VPATRVSDLQSYGVKVGPTCGRHALRADRARNAGQAQTSA